MISTAPNNQGFGDIEGILSALRLGNHRVVEVDTDHLGIARVECVLDINEDRIAPLFLCLSDTTQTEGGFTQTFRTIDFADPPTGQAPVPSAMSIAMEPVEIVSTSICAASPRHA